MVSMMAFLHGDRQGGLVAAGAEREPAYSDLLEVYDVIVHHHLILLISTACGRFSPSPLHCGFSISIQSSSITFCIPLGVRLFPAAPSLSLSALYCSMRN